ncbi:MAG TPA: serine/threonine-protein kinase, partial [Polyangium sp.]|nr:serine/threonine-protein kinase [Polyangium sp.]
MSSAVQPGDVLLGKYRVERVLGQGGMGIVLAARHVQLGELFAIKMLLPKATEHPDAIERFLREARASAKLKGEHVARVHDVGSLENGLPYMVMEHLDGEDLKKVVKSRGGLPVDEAALYAYQACEAVAEAHANGIVHRDLRPANLFLI